MKANERKQLEKNELASKLRGAWDTVTGSSPRGNKVWAVILVVLAAALAWTLYSKFSARNEAALWARLDTASDIASLESIIKDEPNSTQARIARFHLARSRFADAVRKLADESPEERGRAADVIEKVRDDYANFKGEEKISIVMLQEAMAQAAKAEEILASVPKADDANVMRGSLEKALSYYDALKAEYPDCFYAAYAQNRAKDIRDNKSEIEAVNKELARTHAKNLPAPAIPSLPAGVTPQQPLPTGLLPEVPPAPPPTTGDPRSPVPTPPVTPPSGKASEQPAKTPEPPAKTPEPSPKAPDAANKTPPL